MTTLRFVITTVFVFLTGCSSHRPILKEQLEDLGHFESREPASGLEGVVIAAPHGQTDLNSDRLALAISERTGAGLVIAYGFKSKRLGVTQPLVRARPYQVSAADPSERGSVFREYRRILQDTANGDIDLYIGIHRSNDRKVAGRIEVATSGLSFEQVRALKKIYHEIRDQIVGDKQAPKLSLEIEPLDSISWRLWGVKHHGVLLVVEKGLSVRLPQSLSQLAEELYTEVLSLWIDEAIWILRNNPLGLPQIDVELTELGKFELIKSKSKWGTVGVVLGAPHGSYDEYTAEVVKRVSYRTGIAAVIAKGFTPTEGQGWRINVNRPTEKIPYSDGLELHSRRASEVFSAFRDMVFEASGGDLKLYVDIHQYNTDNKIQVATVGITKEQARIIKLLYHKIRSQIIEKEPAIPAVGLWIEPLDEVEIGAWAAKAEGILGLAQKSLHFELPSHKILSPDRTRELYTHLLADLLKGCVPFLLEGQEADLRDRVGQKRSD
jgi:hypothetical protein